MTALLIKGKGLDTSLGAHTTQEPIEPTNMMTANIAIKIRPKITRTGRRTAKIAFPVEISCPSLTPMMSKMKT